ncbi:MAG: hypothetical protein ACI4ES_04570 [Roseburia sp.]
MEQIKLVEAKTEEQLQSIWALYEKAFPKEEKKPISLMLKKREEGFYEILEITDQEEEFRGLVIVILYQDLALLDYFAIEDTKRGTGIGSTALKLLQERYKEKRFFLEIESTKENCPDLNNRVRRKHFYEKNGMGAMKFLVELFGINMELMTYQCELSFEEYHKIFEEVFSKEMSEKVRRI